MSSLSEGIVKKSGFIFTPGAAELKIQPFWQSGGKDSMGCKQDVMNWCL